MVASPFPQAPSEAEAAADLIDMGPDPAATGGLSSQLSGMSKCGRPGVLSCDAVGAGVPAAACQPRSRLPGSRAQPCHKGGNMWDPPSQPRSG